MNDANIEKRFPASEVYPTLRALCKNAIEQNKSLFAMRKFLKPHEASYDFLPYTPISKIAHNENGPKLLISSYSLVNNQNENGVRIIDFVETVMNIFHEEKHLLQLSSFQHKNASNDTIALAKNVILQNGIPESYFYEQNYTNSSIELDAELYSIKRAANFFATIYPNENINYYITTIIQNIDKWYADTNINNIYQAMKNLKTKLQQELITPSPIELPFNHCDHQGNPIKISEQFQHFEENETRKKIYTKAFENSDGKLCHEILHSFIKMHYPQIYKQYPCTHQEWTNTIRKTPKNTQITSYHKETDTDTNKQRIAYLDSRFPNFDDDTPSDDVDYEP